MPLWWENSHAVPSAKRRNMDHRPIQAPIPEYAVRLPRPVVPTCESNSVYSNRFPDRSTVRSWGLLSSNGFD